MKTITAVFGIDIDVSCVVSVSLGAPFSKRGIMLKTIIQQSQMSSAQEKKVEHAVADAKRVSDASAAVAANTAANSSNNFFTNPDPFGVPTGAGGMGPGLNAGMGSGYNPMAESAAADLISNPQALESMMQNPMIQQMIQNDPNIPPHVRQSIQALASNPAMMNQLSQLMRDPNMRSRLQAALQARGGGGLGGLGRAGTGAGWGGMPPASNSNNANNTANANNSSTGGSSVGTAARGGDDQAQTEEEMIAEAIRRSLQDNQ